MDTRAIAVVFGKEVKDGRRDKRAVISALVAASLSRSVYVASRRNSRCRTAAPSFTAFAQSSERLPSAEVLLQEPSNERSLSKQVAIFQCVRSRLQKSPVYSATLPITHTHKYIAHSLF